MVPFPRLLHPNRCVEQIRAWISECESSHEDCELSGARIGPKRRLFIGHRLVKLVPLDGRLNYQYVALSHCWGGEDTAPTTDDNLHDRITSGEPVENLPQTFQDSIQLASKLGINYIWIDALCINQTDEQELEDECRIMGSVYGQAYLVVSAVFAKNNCVGLYARRQQHEVQLCQLTRMGLCQTLPSASIL